jgi:hypothetical protein
MNRWYRAYEGTVSDPKLGEVAILAEASRSVVIAAWHAVLESCASVNDGGRFETNARRVASILAEPVALIERVFAAFKEVGMTDECAVSAWKLRQFESDRDPTATERKRRQRERDREASHVTVTRDSQGVTRLSRRPETKAEADTDTEAKTEKNDGGMVRGAAPTPQLRKDILAIAEAALLTGQLFKQFCDAHPGKCSKEAERKFRELLKGGENPDPIIAAAPLANPNIPAEQWLNERAWAQVLPAEQPKESPLYSPEAFALSEEVMKLVGQECETLDPHWCGVVGRCQTWLSAGWSRDEIVEGVKAIVAKMHPEKIVSINFFDKPLARFIAQQRRPVPKVIEQTAEEIHVQTDRRANPASWQAAKDRNRAAHFELKDALARSGRSRR